MKPCLPDDLLLLVLDGQTGTVTPDAADALPGALAGAVLLELGLRGRLHDRPDGTVTVVGEPTGDPILDDAARRISRVLREYSAKIWVEWLARDVPNLQGLLAERLVASGMLRRRGHAMRRLFSTRRYSVEDIADGRQTRETVRAALVDDTATTDARTLALLTLVRAANLAESLVNGVLADRTLRERLQSQRRVKMLTDADRLQAFPSGLSRALVVAVAAGTLAYAAAQRPHARITGDVAAVTGAHGTGQALLEIAADVGGAVWDESDASDDSSGSD